MTTKTSWSIAVGWVDANGETKRETEVIEATELMDAFVQVINNLDIEDADILSFIEGWEKGKRDIEETYTNIQVSMEYGVLQKKGVRSVLEKYN